MELIREVQSVLVKRFHLSPLCSMSQSRFEFISLLNARLDVLEDKEDREVDRSLVSQAPFVFDAIWTAALALDGARIELEENLGLTLEQFSYDPNSIVARNITEAIFQSALNLNFTGLTVSIALILPLPPPPPPHPPTHLQPEAIKRPGPFKVDIIVHVADVL